MVLPALDRAGLIIDSAVAQTTATKSATKAADDGAPPGTGQIRRGAGNPLAALQLLDRFDANITASIGVLTVNRQQIKGIRLDGQIIDGALVVRKADVADFAGGKGVITGSLRDLGTTPVIDMEFEIEARDAARLMKLAGITAPAAGAMSFKGSAKGTVADLKIDAAMAAFSGNITLAGALANLNADPDWDLRITARFPELRSVLAALGVAAPKRRLGALKFEGVTKGSPERATLDAEATTGAGRMTLNGAVTGLFEPVPGLDLAINSRGLQPQFLAAFAPNPTVAGLLGGLTGVSGKLMARGPVEALTVTLDGVQATGFNGSAAVDGEINDLGGDHPGFAFSVDIRDVDAVRLAAVSGARYRPRARAVPLSLAGRFTGALGLQIKGTGLSGRIGAIDDAGQFFPTTFNGTMRAELAMPRPKYTISLAFGELFLDHYLAREERHGALPREYQLMPGVIQAAAQTIRPPAAARQIPWTRTPIDVTALRDLDADIVLNGNGVTYGKIQIHRPRATLALANGVLQVSQFGGGFTDNGSISGTGTVDMRNEIALAANVAINNADVHRALSWFTKIDRAAGRISIDGTFQARGRSQAELVSSLSGKAKLSGHIRPGKQADAGIAQLIACTGLTSELGGVMEGVLGDFAKDLGPLSGAGVFGEYLDLATVVLASGVGDVSGDIQIDSGLAWSRNIQVISRQGGGRAFIAGDVSLPQYTVYGQIELLTPESDEYSKQVGRHEPYLVAEYAADLDGNDKRTKLDGLFNDRNFKQTNCQGSPLGGVIGGAGGGKIGEIFGTVLGRQPATAQPQPGQPQPTQQPSTQQPAGSQDLLKDLLGGNLGGLGDILKKQ
jgi:hypothetical protein